jgi:hypothetical protein
LSLDIMEVDSTRMIPIPIRAGIQWRMIRIREVRILLLEK